MEIRRATANDWQVLKTVRLDALQESPQAFGSTYSNESQWPDDEWRDWAQKSEEAQSHVIFLAFDAERCVGIVGGINDTDDPDDDAVYLIAMWVAPEARRQGVGRALADAVVRWAASIGQRRVVLSVTETNDSAIALYQSMGFKPTGSKEPLPSHPELDIIDMELRLVGKTPAPSES